MLHITKGEYSRPKILDGMYVDAITAFLFHRGGHADPLRLKANDGKSFIGMFLRGMGFSFDDTDTKGVATPIAEMEKLIESEPRNAQAIFPYISGAEVNNSPTHSHHRYVINFHDFPLCREHLGDQTLDPRDGEPPSFRRNETSGRTSLDRYTNAGTRRPVDQFVSWANATHEQRRDWLRKGIVPLDYSDPVATDWPDLLAIVEQRVRPDREQLGTSAIDRAHKARWWQYANDRPQLRTAIGGLERVLACAIVSNKICFTFLPANMVFSHKLVVFPFQNSSAFCILQSNVHEIWGRFFSSTMKDDINYSPSDCFETFPFPDNWEADSELEATGKACFEFRATLMAQNDEGMTKTYNRFHDPYDDHPEIGRLRELHAAMDRAVLNAYGWTDIPTDCDFFLDYEIDDATWGRKKKPYRYRWPDSVRDEVLARLLALNAERAAEEARAGTEGHPTRTQSPPESPRTRYRQTPASRPTLLVAEPKPLLPSRDA